MEIIDIKNDLHDRIEHADDREIQAIYDLVLGYFNKQDYTTDWDSFLNGKRIK